MTLDDLFRSASGGCQSPGCTHKHSAVVLHSGCHPEAATWVTVDVRKGTMQVTCSVCNQVIITVNHNLSN